MNELKIFKHPDLGEIHTLQMGEEPWFVGEDIAKMLGYNDISDALQKYIDEGDKLPCLINKTGQSQSVIVINVTGLYSLIHFSKHPDVKKIKLWIQNDVLPVLRRRIDSDVNEDRITELYVKSFGMDVICPLRAFSNDEFGTIRTLSIGGEPWFVGEDVAAALGYGNPTDTVRKYCHRRVQLYIGTLTKSQEGGSSSIKPVGMDFISERDLYCLVTNSESPNAENFDGWVDDEVIPAVRARGGRIINQALMTPVEAMSTAILTAQKTIESQKEQIETLLAVNKDLIAVNEKLLSKEDAQNNNNADNN